MIDHDKGTAQLLLVILEMPHLDRLRRQKTVPARRVSTPQTRNLEIHNVTVESCDHSVQWPDPAKAAAAPAHRFRPRQTTDGIWNSFRNDIHRRAPLSRDRRHVVRTFIVAALLALLEGNACGF